MSEEIDILDELKKMVDRDPFVPFMIVMGSGDRYEVADPYAVALGRRTAVVVPPRGAGHSVLRLNQISSLEALEPADS